MELAKRLKIGRPALDAYIAIEGSPKDLDFDQWKLWLDANAVRLAGSKELRDEKVRLEIQLARAKLDREQRKVFPAEEIDRLLAAISSRAQTMLYQYLETEAPPKLDGLASAQVRPILREMADRICDAMDAMIDDFKNS